MHAMSKRRERDMSIEAQRELQAIDAALRDGIVAGEHATLAELATAVRALRPRPREEFVRALDVRAERGFKRNRDHQAPTARSSRRQWGAGHERREPGSLRAVLLRPAAALLLIAILAVAVAVPLSLSGGGHARRFAPVSTPQPGSPAMKAPARASVEAVSATGAVTSQSGSGALHAGERQVERTATLELGVAPASIESTSQQVFTLVNAFHGYVQQSSVSTAGAERGGATFDLRLPSSNLTGAIAALSHLGHVRSENDTTNDVTDQANSLQRSLGDARAERMSLLTQIAHASDPQRAAALKAKLRTAEAHISRLQGTLRALMSRISYTSVALSLTPQTTLNGGATGGLTPSAAAREAARILDTALAVLVLATATLLPFAALAVAGWIAVTVTRRRLRERTLDAS
jgi:hypothetical protein